MAPPKKSTLPKKLPDNFEVTDTDKKRWRLGRLIGEGGFGLIYLASQDVNRPVPEDADFVVKVEYQENGPLFSELKFYQRAAKPESMAKWKKGKKLDFLGIPTYWGSGLAEHGDLRYRFMVMDRLGSDLQKVFKANGGRLMKDTVLQLGQRLVDVLEYIHENEYVHADIKAANLMLGHRDPEQVYLADYGLSYRYCPDGVHKEYKENPKKGHNGTIEYTSLDAHKGVAPSRRGDLQILGFCLLHWLCGSLPWDADLKSPSKVQESKTWLMDNLPHSVQKLSENGGEVASFLLYLTTLGYQDKPDYQHLRELLGSAARGPLDFSTPGTPAGSATRAKKPGKAKGPSRTRPGPPEVDHQEPNRVKSKPVPACYIRGPPITKAHSQQKEDVSPAARSLRPRTARSYREESESEEEDARSKPILSRHLRGPPSSPGAQPKQRTKPRRTSRNQMTETSERQQDRVQPQRRDPTWTQSSLEPALSSSRPELDERFPHPRPGMDERLPNPRLELDERFPHPRPGLDERLPNPRPGLDERLPNPRLELDEKFLHPRPGLDEKFLHPRPGLDERFPNPRVGLDERFLHHRLGLDERFPHPRPGLDERFSYPRPGLSQQQQLCYKHRGSCGEPEGSVHRDWSPEAAASRMPRLKSWVVCLSVFFLGVLCLELAKVHLNPFKERRL